MAPSSDLNTPEIVDMRDVLWPVENLGQIPASAASAVATALAYHCNRVGAEPTQLSALFIHYNARKATRQERENGGTTLDAAMQAVTTFGACKDASWPVDPTKVAAQPPAQAYDEAKQFAGILSSHPSDPIEALALRYPVPFVANLPERCLRDAGITGKMPTPTADERQHADKLVNHAMVLVGYNRNTRTYLARNCWGAQWGDNGHCTISFDTMNVIAPPGSEQLWFIATGDAAAQAKAQWTTQQTSYQAAEPQKPVAPPPGKLADMAAKMRDEIRGDLSRDMADAQKRIRDMLARPAGQPAAQPPAQPPGQAGARGACDTCNGSGLCWICRGTATGCSCNRGACNRCGGTGQL